MADEKHQPTVGGTRTDDDPDQNVDKIREILFGGQMRDYQRRFDALEANINAASEQLRKDLSHRLDSLEGFVRREIELLSERLATERRERGEERADAEAAIQDTRRRFETALAGLDERAAQETRAIRATIEARTGELAQTLQNSRDETQALTNRLVAELEDRKLGREDLAAMLSEVALRLNREFDISEE